MIRFYLVCLPYWIFVDYIFVRLNLTYGKQFTMYVQGYLQGSKNGRVVTIAISVWIIFQDREKMTEILKATRKTMQISRVFIIILLLNEITYDFFSLCHVNAFLSSVGCQSSIIHFNWCVIVSCFISSWHYFRMIWFVSFKTAL